MRKNPTTAEAKLWPYLRAKRMKGLKFRRQHPLFHFIVDFFCYEQKIIIEVDGSVHEYQFQHDKMRDELFSNKGYTILRFSNEQVLHNTKNVLEKIATVCNVNPLLK